MIIFVHILIITFLGVQQEMEECDRAEEKRRAIEDDDDAPSGSGLSKL